MNTEHKRNLQRAADFCREMKHDALAEACSRASAHIVELERAEAERDALAEQLNSVTSMAERFGQERDALRADAERLDWLANFLADVIIGDADPCLHFIAADGNDQRNSWPQVWRRAIDAARKEGEG